MTALSMTSPLRTSNLHNQASTTTPGGNGFKKTSSGLDRFIPTRGGMDIDSCHYSLAVSGSNAENVSTTASDAEGGPNGADTMLASPSKRQYVRRLAEGLNMACPGDEKNHRVLAFKNKAPAPPNGYDASHLSSLYNGNAGPRVSRKAFRHVPAGPERILDAPDLLDDYYLNLLDWGANNTVAIALGPTVYLWNAGTGDIQALMECSQPDEVVTAVNWAADGKHLSVGTSSAAVQIWDVERSRQIRNLTGHTARVGACAWNNHVLSTGGRDSVILNHDVRIREHRIATLRGHEQEVCGLKWSPSGTQLASGGNDNLLHIWDGPTPTGASHRLTQHCAAVKAVAWCPFQSNLLATGGGTADRTIKFWNTHTGALLNSIDTGSQVCSLQWNRHEREILSSHGFSQNQLCLWRYPSMTKVAELNGHTSRVLHLATSPDGMSVCSAAADETLRFWRCFGDAETTSKTTKPTGNSNMLRSINIR
mmetsp:Transcript_44336/g.111334  ORF Transcript_44336/g.111334 Transcript_44336/m.111334 type:complete len:479 (-) Transcript_44336:28-1464(-)